MNKKIPRHAKDIIQKIVADQFQDALLQWYGLELPRITGALPTHIPEITIQERILDYVFALEDGTLMHIEFQSKISKLDRFAHYSLALATHHQRLVRTIIVYLGNVEKAPDTVRYGSVFFSVTNVYLAHMDGQRVSKRLKSKIQTEQTWNACDMLDLTFLPFMKHASKTPAERAHFAASLAQRLPYPQSLYATALIAGLTGATTDSHVLKSIKEVIRMNQLIRELEQEAIQRGWQTGYNEGREEGREEGHLEAAIAIIASLLAQKFGSVPTHIWDRLRRVDYAILVQELPAFIMASETFEDITSWLSRQS